MWTGLLDDNQGRLREYISARVPVRFRSLISPDDVLQQVCLRLTRRPPRRADLRGVQEALWRATRAVLLDMLRQVRCSKRGGRISLFSLGVRVCSSARLAPGPRAPAPTPSAELQFAELVGRLRESVAALPPDYRHVIERHELQGLPVAQVAREMRRSEAAVHGLLQRALEYLRSHIAG